MPKTFIYLLGAFCLSIGISWNKLDPSLFLVIWGIALIALAITYGINNLPSEEENDQGL